jgi:hypothetical protein
MSLMIFFLIEYPYVIMYLRFDAVYMIVIVNSIAYTLQILGTISSLNMAEKSYMHIGILHLFFGIFQKIFLPNDAQENIIKIYPNHQRWYNDCIT